MAYKKLKIICDADDVLISCNAYLFLSGYNALPLFLRIEK